MNGCILVDALAYWQEVIFKEFGIDLLQYRSLPLCTTTKSAVNESSVLGIDYRAIHAFSVSKQYQRRSMRFCPHKVTDQTLESIRYFDIKSLYASVQKMYRHPVRIFQFLKPVPDCALHEMALEYNEKKS